MKELIFKGGVFNGSLDMQPTKMVCIPSKPHYAAVDISLRANIDKGPNIVVADIDNNCLSFEEKKKLGYEIEKRWNAFEGLTEFAKVYMRAAFEGGSLDGSDLQDMGVEHGLLELVEYDPETHGEEAQNEYGSEKGDPYYVYTNILK